MIQDLDKLRSWLALTHAPKLGPVKLHSLLEIFQSPDAILAAGKSAWQEAGMPSKTIEYLLSPDWEKVDSDLKWAEQDKAGILTIEDESYPQMLKDIPDAPAILYVFGQAEVLKQPQLAIVGSRNPTHAGMDTAHDFAAFLANVGVTVTSGMALGIDASSHQGALDACRDGGGCTVAVTGTGLDRVYPACHRDLAHNIAEKGVLVSEFSPGTPPLPANFPRRNRIISGLSMGVLVVEAALQSGSLITARLAVEQGREVFAVPGSIHHPLAKGCHALIRQGAKLVETAEHILEELGGFAAMLDENNQMIGDETAQDLLQKSGLKKQEKEPNSAFTVDSEYQDVLKSVDFEPTSVDKVVERSGLTADAVCSMLLVLELQGYVTALSGGYYCQNR